MEDQAFLTEIVQALVSKPEAVKVERKVDEQGVLLTLHVDPSDIGYVIGKKGQTVTALRTLVRIVGAKNNSRTSLIVYEPEGSRGPRKPREDDMDMSVVNSLDI